MEFRITKSNIDGKLSFHFDMMPKELSDLKDEICESVIDSNSAVVRDREGLSDAILGTLANFGIVIE